MISGICIKSDRGGFRSPLSGEGDVLSNVLDGCFVTNRATSRNRCSVDLDSYISNPVRKGMTGFRKSIRNQCTIFATRNSRHIAHRTTRIAVACKGNGISRGRKSAIGIVTIIPTSNGNIVLGRFYCNVTRLVITFAISKSRRIQTSIDTRGNHFHAIPQWYLCRHATVIRRHEIRPTFDSFTNKIVDSKLCIVYIPDTRSKIYRLAGISY